MPSLSKGKGDHRPEFTRDQSRRDCRWWMSCVISFDFRRLEFHSVRTDTTHPPLTRSPLPLLREGSAINSNLNKSTDTAILLTHQKTPRSFSFGAKKPRYHPISAQMYGSRLRCTGRSPAALPAVLESETQYIPGSVLSPFAHFSFPPYGNIASLSLHYLVIISPFF